MNKFVLSGFHLSEILKYQNETFDISLDLGMSKGKITKEENYIIFPDGQKLDIDIIKKANKRSNHDCFLLENSSLYFIYIFLISGRKICHLVIGQHLILASVAQQKDNSEQCLFLYFASSNFKILKLRKSIP